jgi:ADP-ribose pyrophosphatase YjhB (NUDIX family)
LIVRDVGENTQWDLPGGRLHVEESLQTGLYREIKEEVGLEIEGEQLFYSEQFRQKRDDKWCVFIAYICQLKNSAADIVPLDGEIAEWKWISQDQILEQPLYGRSLRALEAFFTPST